MSSSSTIRYSLIKHADRGHSIEFACLVFKCNWQCVQPSLLKFALLIFKLDDHPFNEMVIKPLLYILSLPLVLAGQLSIDGRRMLIL